MLLSPQDAIEKTLTDHGVILYKHLSYLSDVDVTSARNAMREYTSTSNSSTTYPIYLVSGSRYVHGQLSYVYLITRPSTLEATKAKFQSVMAVQLYAIVRAPNEPSAAQLQDSLAIGQGLLQQIELEQYTEQPLLAQNAFRSNAHANVTNLNIQREANAYSVMVKPVKNDLVLQESLFSPLPDNKNNTATTSSSTTKKDATIVKKQTKLSFGTAASTTQGSNNSLFDDDDDIVMTSKTNPKSTQSKTNSSGVKRPSSIHSTALFDEIDHDSNNAKDTTLTDKPTKTINSSIFASSAPKSSDHAKPSHSLFDEFDDEPIISMSSSKKMGSNKSTSANSSTKKAQKASVVVESEDETTDDSDDGFSALDQYTINYCDDDNNTDTNKKKSFMGDSESEDDMVKSAKGLAITANNKKFTTVSSSGKRIIDDESDDDDAYAKSVVQENKNQGKVRETSYKEISAKEWDEMQREEEEENKRIQEEKDKAKKLAAKEALMGSTNAQKTTRVDPLTGKNQKLVTTYKMVSTIDDEGFEVKKRTEVSEWVDVEVKPTTTPKTNPPKSAPKDVPTTTPPQPKPTTKKEPSKTGGILNFFGKK